MRSLEASGLDLLGDVQQEGLTQCISAVVDDDPASVNIPISNARVPTREPEYPRDGKDGEHERLVPQ